MLLTCAFIILQDINLETGVARNKLLKNINLVKLE